MKYAIRQKKYTQSDNLIEHEIKETVRLNKFISETGLFSRREADRIILENRVSVNNKIASVGEVVNYSDIVKIDDKQVFNNNKKIYIVLNKPSGIVCTTDTNIDDNIKEFMNFKETIFPIGRLDKDSKGLILLTNDGDIVNKILREENGHEKEYIVTTDKPIDDEFIHNMESGVSIYNLVANKREMTKECIVKKMNKNTFKIILKQGLNRQIRRMCNELGYKVNELIRIRVMNIDLLDLKEGQWRYLTNDELIELNKRIKGE